jgi:tetratricopeptide (TPR) repeat protein
MISKLAEQNPEQPEVLSLLAQALSDAGQKEAALQAAQLALQSFPNHSDLDDSEKAKLHYLIGMNAVEAGQLDKAIHHLDQSIELDPTFVEPYLELGFAYNKQRQYLKAQNIFQRATVIAPEDARTFLHSGLALKEGKDYQSAETMLRRASQLAPTDVQIRKHLAGVAALNLVHNPHNIHIAAER